MIYATTVVRHAQPGDTHGGLFQLDFDAGEARCLFAWDDPDFDFQGRGGDRGLRGFVFKDGRFYVAAAGRILVLTPEGELEREIRHPLLGLLHDMMETPAGFVVVSTRYDSLLWFNIEADAFTCGLHLDTSGRMVSFNPATQAPPANNVWHLNSVDRRHVSGLRLPGAVTFDGEITPTPYGTHNVKQTKHGLIYCDTAHDQLHVEGVDFPVPDAVPVICAGEARSRFMRGLLRAENALYVGLSPARVYEFDLGTKTWGRSVVISENYRCAVQSIGYGPSVD